MATTETWDVDAGGAGDYSTLSAAEVAKQADIVAADKVMVFECRSSDSSTDPSSAVFSGWTTDATRWIEVIGTESHGGKWNTSDYRIVVGSAHVVQTASGGGAANFFLRNLQIESTGGGNGVMLQQLPSAQSAVERCIVRQTGGASNVGIYIGIHGPFGLSNNIVYDWATGINFAADPITKQQFAHSNTIHACTTGINSASTLSLQVVKNTIADDCTDGFLAGTGWHADSDYNASDIASDAPGGNSQNGTDTTFVDEGNDDFHLSTSDTVSLDNGLDISGDSDYAVTVDNENTTRTGSWDIGAHQATAASGTRRVFVVG